jgi:NAD(P)-dependent dehydrogenase (short-subunit alcohol dehydrogenase family)
MRNRMRWPLRGGDRNLKRWKFLSMPLSPAPEYGRAMLPPGTFDGKVIAVTGGGTGLGKAMALEFARLGGKIAILSRGEEHRRKGVAAIEAEGGQAAGFEVDVRKAEVVAQAFDAIEAELGAVDVLINNAAGNFACPAEDLSANAWATVVDIVLNGTFNCSREFGRRRIGSGRGGAILNIGAAYAWTGGPGAAHSASAKAGVTNLSRSLAVEWAPVDIRINTLVPGPFPHEDFPPALQGHMTGSRGGARLPAQRVGETHELGWAATYLCSPYAAFVTGLTFVIDGGHCLRQGLAAAEFVPVREQLKAGPFKG